MPPWFPAGEPEHLRLRWRAHESTHPEGAIDLIDRADSLAPVVAGFLDGQEFDAWRDTDDIFATVLEAWIGERYAWIPLEAIRRLSIGEVVDGFAPGELTLPDHGTMACRLPARYAGSEGDARPEIRDGSATDWHAPGDGPVRGLGGRLWVFGDAEVALAECRRIEVIPERLSLM